MAADKEKTEQRRSPTKLGEQSNCSSGRVGRSSIFTHMGGQDFGGDTMEICSIKASGTIEVDKLGKPSMDSVFREGAIDYDMASRAESAEQHFGRRCRERRQDL